MTTQRFVHRSMAIVLSIMAVIVATTAFPPESQAYVGPGAGLSAIGSVLAVAGALVLGVVGFVWYPVKRLRRNLRARPGKAQQ